MKEYLYAILKLINGQEIFAKIYEDEANSLDPFVVMYDPLVQEEYFNEDGSTVVTMNKYSTATHERMIPLAKHTIISTCIMSDPFKEYYKQSIDISTMSLAKYDEKLIDMASKMAAHNIVFKDNANGHIHQSASEH